MPTKIFFSGCWEKLRIIIVDESSENFIKGKLWFNKFISHWYSGKNFAIPPFYFDPHHKHLDISQVITAEDTKNPWLEPRPEI